MSKMKRSRAFTLVELLVVIAIIGILIGMLLPAVQQVREAARRIDCSNKMRQLTLSMLNYESANSHLPSGIASCTPPCTADQITGTHGNPGALWGTIVLPFIEQNSVFEQVRAISNNFEIPSAAIGRWDPPARNVLPSFICPSCPLTETNPFHREHGKSNYVGVIGPKMPLKFLFDYTNLSEINTVSSGISGSISTADERAQLEWPGIMFLNSKTRIGSVTDGLSNTFILGERGGEDLQGGLERQAAVWCVGRRAAWLYAALAPTDGDPTFTLNGAIGNPDVASINFSSSHTGGANFSRGDGSITFISNSIAGTTFESLGTKSGGEVVEIP